MKIMGEAAYVDSKGHRFEIEGIGNISDDLELKSLHIEGESRGSRINLENLEVEGEISVDEIIVTNLNIEGILKSSKVQAGKISIESQSGSIGEIQCKSIRVFNNRKSKSRIRIDRITASEVDLENCDVESIECTNAIIRSNCAIRKLSVKGDYTIDGGSRVDEIIKI